MRPSALSKMGKGIACAGRNWRVRDEAAPLFPEASVMDGAVVALLSPAVSPFGWPLSAAPEELLTLVSSGVLAGRQRGVRWSDGIFFNTMTVPDQHEAAASAKIQGTLSTGGAISANLRLGQRSRMAKVNLYLGFQMKSPVQGDWQLQGLPHGKLMIQT